ncbi:MAG: hypothetical protein JOZ15_13890, partial [Acidobacteria bacterium]|nr:hypothetical protein [Acidobacteriota bacterium]
MTRQNERVTALSAKGRHRMPAKAKPARARTAKSKPAKARSTKSKAAAKPAKVRAAKGKPTQGKTGAPQRGGPQAAAANITGPRGQVYADPKPSPGENAFQVNNTSDAYYNSPYYLAHKSQVQPIPPARTDVPPYLE